jgi:hypothetical protein
MSKRMKMGLCVLCTGFRFGDRIFGDGRRL